jgi:4-carboxymuconolactone decarboxylase
MKQREDFFMSTSLADAGIEIRKSVLGADYVTRSMQSANSFNGEFQQMLNTYCWGEIWTREGLPRQTRSLINIALMVALNQPNELRNHVRGALNNGVEVNAIKEVLMQSTVYCGVPLASLAFNAAMEELKELGIKL